MGSALKNHLLASKNLCSLINRINIEYFTVNREGIVIVIVSLLLLLLLIYLPTCHELSI